jgi:hypothetical protein
VRAGPDRVLWGEVAAAAAGHGLRGLPTPPIIILTSSADRAQFGAKINSYWFIAKADISSTVIASLASTRNRPDRILTLPQSGPRHDDECPASTRYGKLRSAIPPADRRTGQRGHHTHNR